MKRPSPTFPLLAACLAAGCSSPQSRGDATARAQVTTEPMPTNTHRTAAAAIPPIDAAAPTTFQTATFALG